MKDIYRDNRKWYSGREGDNEDAKPEQQPESFRISILTHSINFITFKQTNL